MLRYQVVSDQRPTITATATTRIGIEPVSLPRQPSHLEDITVSVTTFCKAELCESFCVKCELTCLS